MASNVRPHGNNVSIEVDSAVVSGDIVRQGNLVGVAQYDATRGNDGAMYTVVAIEGVGNAVSADTSGYVVGEPIFAVGANGEPCDTSPTTGDVVLGIVTAVTPDRVWFKLSPAVSSGGGGGGADIDWSDINQPDGIMLRAGDEDAVMIAPGAVSMAVGYSQMAVSSEMGVVINGTDSTYLMSGGTVTLREGQRQITVGQILDRLEALEA